MNFDLTQEHLDIQKRAKEFVEKEVLPGVIERDEQAIYPSEAYQKLVKEGFVGFQYPKEYGGLGKDYQSYILTLLEIGKVDASLCVLYSVSLSLFLGALMKYGTEDQKKKYIKEVCEGKATGCFALTEENAGSDASGVQTLAIKQGDKYIVNGKKRYITNATHADYCMLVAKTDPDKNDLSALSAFFVDMKTPGISIGHVENKMGLRSCDVAEIIFDNVEIPADALFGKHGDGFKIAMHTLNGGRLGVASQGLGIAMGAFDRAVAHLKNRVQFGKPLYKNQYLAFKVADLKNVIDQAYLILMNATWLQDQKRLNPVLCAQAKLLCTDAAMHLTTECVQLMGGSGYMKEFHVERMMRDAKITQIYEGTNEIQRLVISKGVF